MAKVLAVLASALAALTFAPVAPGDQVYHSQHVALNPVDSSPGAGFVENIHPNGPQVFAHEIYALEGAEPDTTYQVTLFIYSDCSPTKALVAAIPTAQVQTNTAGNGLNDFFIPAVPASFHNQTFGVQWTVVASGGTSAYETDCSLVTLD